MKTLYALVFSSFLFPALAAADEAPAKDAAKEPAAKEPAKEETKPDQLPAEVKEEKPVAAPDAAHDPVKATGEDAEAKFNKWFENFKTQHPKAAEHFSKIRDAVKAAKAKWEAAKDDKTAKREFAVARRKLHGFWVGFNSWRIQHAREGLRRWAKQVQIHRARMRALEKEILK